EPGIAPTTNLTGGPSGTTRGTTPTFTFAPTQYGAESSCAVDGGTPVPCQRSFTTPVLEPGPHSFSVSSGVFGAQGPAVARDFTVDPTALATTIDSGPSGPTNVAAPTFTFQALDGGTAFTCEIDGDQPGPCDSPFTVPAPLPDGPHTFTVKADGDDIGDSRSFTVDTTPPQTSISSGPSEGAATAHTQPTFTFASSEDPSTFVCTLDGEPVPCTSFFTPAAPLAEGQHTLTVGAVDAVGNADPAPLARNSPVDAPPPETTIDGGPAGPTNVAAPTFTFSA